MNISKRIKLYLAVIIFSITVACQPAAAQRLFANTSDIYFGQRALSFSAYEVTLGTGYDQLISLARNQLNNIYGPAIYFDAGIAKRINHFTFGLGGSSGSFHQKHDNYTYKFSGTNTGVYTYYPYPISAVYAHVVYNIKLFGDVQGYGGINLGRYFAKYGLTLSSNNGTVNTPSTDHGMYAAPDFGFNFHLSDAILVDFHAMYNSYTTALDISGKTGENKTYYTVAGGAAIVYRFDVKWK
jgi:hypothetical protein